MSNMQQNYAGMAALGLLGCDCSDMTQYKGTVGRKSKFTKSSKPAKKKRRQQSKSRQRNH